MEGGAEAASQTANCNSPAAAAEAETNCGGVHPATLLQSTRYLPRQNNSNNYGNETTS